MILPILPRLVGNEQKIKKGTVEMCVIIHQRKDEEKKTTNEKRF